MEEPTYHLVRRRIESNSRHDYLRLDSLRGVDSGCGRSRSITQEVELCPNFRSRFCADHCVGSKGIAGEIPC